MMIDAQLSEVLKITELYILNGRIVWCVNYINKAVCLKKNAKLNEEKQVGTVTTCHYQRVIGELLAALFY